MNVVFFGKAFNNIQDREISTHSIPTIIGLTVIISLNLAGGEILAKSISTFLI